MIKTEVSDLVNKGEMLPLMEEFYTIQGVGYYKGTAAYFVRVGGCDVGCHWCDVKESWNAAAHAPTHVDDIVKNASKYSESNVVNGDESLTGDMAQLTSKLESKGLVPHIETPGAYNLTEQWDWMCFSPKKNKPTT